jgi:hypothetical protein
LSMLIIRAFGFLYLVVNWLRNWAVFDFEKNQKSLKMFCKNPSLFVGGFSKGFKIFDCVRS